MEDLKPTDPQYIDALALNKFPKLGKNHHYGLDEVAARINRRNGYVQGAKDILEHTGHEKLLEAMKHIVEICDGNDSSHAPIYYCAKQAIQQSEANKLNQ